MNGRKKARSLCCHQCWHRDQKHERHSGPGGFARYCDGGEGGAIEIDDSFLEGPVANCPQDKWTDLDPVGPLDAQEWEAWNEQRNREKVRERRNPRLKQTLHSIEASEPIPADARTALAVLVAAGAVPGWLAEEIDQEL